MNDRCEIKENNIFGRYLVASRDLKDGEVILQENATIIGPQINAFPICFQCSTPLNANFAISCKKCKKALLCSMHCKGKMHTENECNALAKTELSQLDFLENPQIIMALRCLLMKAYDANRWNEFIKLESHLNERKGKYIWNLHKNQTERVLNELKCVNEEDMNANLVQVICGILDVNSFEIRPPNLPADPQICLRGVFLHAALMAHDCTGNTHLALDDNFKMTIRASEQIPKGNIIFFNYANGMQGNFERRTHLKEGKYFDCTCKRCGDSSEFNTNLSALLCPKCKTGYVNSATPLTTLTDNWICVKCSKTFNGNLIKTTLNLCKDILEGCENDLDESASILKRFARTLAPQHYLIIDLKQKMIAMLHDSSNIAQMQRKIDLCEDLLPIYKILEPGLSRHVAIINYQLQQAKMHLANHEYNCKVITMNDFIVKLNDSHAILKDAVKCLLYEPKESPEGRLAQKALNDLQVLRGTINDLNKMAKMT